MIEVYAEYVNKQSSKKEDFFIWKRIEVKGHATNTGYSTNKLVCASVSAIVGGIKELLSFSNYQVEISKGYFNVCTDINFSRKRWGIVHGLGGLEYVYALETLIWQLYYIYKSYPTAFKKFDMVDLKGEIDNYDEQTKQHKRTSKRKYNTLGLHSRRED